MAKYIPVFAGKTPEGEEIVIYQGAPDTRYSRPDQISLSDAFTQLYIKLSDGELWALSPNATVTLRRDDEDERIHVLVNSPEWSGTAVGTKKDLIEAEAQRWG